MTGAVNVSEAVAALEAPSGPADGRRPRPRSVLIIGSGPVVIGQAAEFDYAGTQACRALREEGVRTILLNSNPATIMTDPGVADVVYLEPLTVEVAERILIRERPDGILAGLGGQTGLNLAMDLARYGRPCPHRDAAARHPDRGDRDGGGSRAVPRPARPDRPAVRAVGDRRRRHGRGTSARPRNWRSSASGCRRSSGRPSRSVAPAAASSPPKSAYRERIRTGLRLSPIHQVMVERCLVGWQEIEYEVMRDADDTCIAVCSMENVDPLGVHTGDSIVVAPVQTLPDPVHQRLRSAALAIIRALGVEGGCNVQFALSPSSAEYAVIEVNPRVSRSSALASKATGYPIARVAAQIAVGRRLAEIPNAITGTTVAAFEPALDYVVVKLPRFPFDKFPTADRTLGSQMKATGEVMAIDRTFGAALNKALRGLEQAGAGFLAEDPAWGPTLDILGGPVRGVGERPAALRREDLVGEVFVGQDGLVCADRTNAIAASRPILLRRFLAPSDSRLWRLLALLRRGVPAAELQVATGIAPWFVGEMERLVDVAARIGEEGRSALRRAARLGQACRVRRPRHRDADRPLRRQRWPRAGRQSACARGSPWSTPAPRSSPRRRPISTPRTPQRARRRRRPRSRALRRS